MCDGLPPTTSLFSVVKFRPLRLSFTSWKPKPRSFPFRSDFGCSNGCNSDETGFRNGRAFHSFKPNRTLGAIFCAVGSQDGRFDYELGLEEEGASRLHFEPSEGDSTLGTLDAGLSDLNGFASTKAKMNDRRRYDDAMESPSLNFLKSKDDIEEGKRNGNGGDGLEEETSMVTSVEDSGSQVKESGRCNGEVGFRRKRQVMRRSGVLAKQVISIQSARSMGFVSQLWVDTAAVGDVVLIQDETVIENEFKIIGLETLVGYKVVTPALRTIGKIRGYTFNINSGAVESLELDSFGISIIPSTLISTYSLLVEDVLEVVSDSVVVDEAAASRIQRLSKGFLGAQNVGNSRDVDFREYGGAALSDRRWRKKRSYNRQKYEDWDYPKDYL